MKSPDALDDIGDGEEEDAFSEEGSLDSHRASSEPMKDIADGLHQRAKRRQVERDALFGEILDRIVGKGDRNRDWKSLESRRELIEEIVQLYNKTEEQIVRLLAREVSSRNLLLDELDDKEITSLARQIAEREGWV